MANYQNNMRYGRRGNMYQQRPSQGNGNSGQRIMPGMDGRYGNSASGMESGCASGCDTEGTAPKAECGRMGGFVSQPEHRMGSACPVKERREPESCGCRREDELAGMEIAMAYVPWQRWRKIYEVCEGFQRGSIFEELDKPFLGRGGCNR